MKTTVITIAAICAAAYAVSSCGFNGNSAFITSAGMYDAGDWNYLEKQTRRRARENGRVWVVSGPIIGDGIFRLGYQAKVGPRDNASLRFFFVFFYYLPVFDTSIMSSIG